MSGHFVAMFYAQNKMHATALYILSIHINNCYSITEACYENLLSYSILKQPDTRLKCTLT